MNQPSGAQSENTMSSGLEIAPFVRRICGVRCIIVIVDVHSACQVCAALLIAVQNPSSSLEIETYGRCDTTPQERAEKCAALMFDADAASPGLGIICRKCGSGRCHEVDGRTARRAKRA